MYNPMRQKDKKFDITKYDSPEKRAKLAHAFSCIANWMPQDSQSAQSLSKHIQDSEKPRLSIVESTNFSDNFNRVIQYCNTVLTAPEGSDKRTNSSLRTSIRRLQDFRAVVTDPMNCQSSLIIKEFHR